MGWRTLLVAMAVIGLVLGAVACGDDDQDEATPTIGAEGRIAPASGTEPSPPSLSTPTPSSGRRTGIPEVDAVVAAVESAEPDRVFDLFRFTPIPCEPPTSDTGYILCLPEEPEGTLVDSLPVSLCKDTRFRRETVDAYLRVELEGPTLYAVYRAPPGLAQGPAQYVAVFSKPPPGARRGLAVAIDQGQIVTIFFAKHTPNACAQTAAELVESLGLDDAVLPPVEP